VTGREPVKGGDGQATDDDPQRIGQDVVDVAAPVDQPVVGEHVLDGLNTAANEEPAEADAEEG